MRLVLELSRGQGFRVMRMEEGVKCGALSGSHSGSRGGYGGRDKGRGGRGGGEMSSVTIPWRVLFLKAGQDRTLLEGRMEEKMELFEGQV